jgi:hypothetical protein
VADRLELLLEAERRGLLPPEKSAALGEARKSGLVPGGEAPPTAPSPQEPGLWDRAKIMARDSFEQSGTGTILRRNNSGQAGLDQASQMDEVLGAIARGERPDPRNPYARTPRAALENARDTALTQGGARQAEWMPKERARRAEVEALPSFADDPTVGGKLAKGAVNLGAMLVGSLPSPENLIPVGRGATLARTFGKGAAVNAAVSAPVDAMAQQQDVQLGLQEAIDPVRTAISAAISGAVGGAVNAAPQAGRMMLDARRNPSVPDVPAPPTAGLVPPDQVELGRTALQEQVRAEGLPREWAAPVPPRAEVMPPPQGVDVRAYDSIRAEPEAPRLPAPVEYPDRIPPQPRSVGDMLGARADEPPALEMMRGAEGERAQIENIPVASKVSDGVESEFSQAPRPKPQALGVTNDKSGGGDAAAREQIIPAGTKERRPPEMEPMPSGRAPSQPAPPPAAKVASPTGQTQGRAAEGVAPAPQSQSAPMNNKRISDAFSSLVSSRGRDDVGEILFNWNESRLHDDGKRIVSHPGRDGQYSRGALGGKITVGKRAFIDWLMSDGPFDEAVYGKGIRADAEWTKKIDAARAATGLQGAPHAQNNASHQEVRRAAEPQHPAAPGERGGGNHGSQRPAEAAVEPARGDRPGGDAREAAAAREGASAPHDEGGGAKIDSQAQEKVEAPNAPTRHADAVPDRSLPDAQPEHHADAGGGDPARAVGEEGGLEDVGGRARSDTGGVEGVDHLADKTPEQHTADAKQSGSSDVGTLYANPFGKVLGWAAGDTDAWAKKLADVMTAAKALKGNRHPDAGVKVRENWIRAVLDSSSADIRARVEQTKSETARSVVDHFHQEAGSGRAVGETFESAQHAWVNQHLVKLDPALSKLTPDELKQAVAQITGGKPATAAAKAIDTALKDALKHMKDAGVDVGEVRNYFPREFDKRLVSQRPKAEFVDALAHEYRRQGLSATDAHASAEALYNQQMFGEQNSLYVGGKGAGPAPFLKGRVFGAAVDSPSHPLNKFLVRDPMQVLPKYLMAAAKRAEIAKRFGDNFSQWDEIAAKITKEGGGDVLEGLKDYVSMAAGLQGSGVSSRAQRASSWMRTWGSLMFLEKATLSSLTEFIVPALRTGNVMDIGRSLSNTITSLLGTTKGAERRAFAEDLGLIAGHLSDGLMAARWSGGDPVSTAESKVLTNYFRRIGLTQWTDATQVAAANLSQVFMRRLAHDFDAGGKLTKRHLADLGVPEAKQAEFVQFVLSKNGGMPGASDLTGPMGDAYARAVRTFTRQSIMAPSAALKPKYMSTPIGSIIGQLQSFNYAFYENVMKRAGRMTKEAVTGADYTMAERTQLIAPTAMIPLLWAGAYALGESRDAVLGDPNRRKDETQGHKVIKAIGRGAPIAPIEPLVQYATSARYRTDAVKFFAGPVIGTLSTGADATRDVFMANSSNTNTAERKAAKAAYDMLFEPTINLALGLTPVSPLSAVATQVAGSGAVREKFVAGVAGEKKAGRDAGRDSGRDSGR